MYDGRKSRVPLIIVEASRERLALLVARRIRREGALAAFAELFVIRMAPAVVRSDNAVQQLLGVDRCEGAPHHFKQPHSGMATASFNR